MPVYVLPNFNKWCAIWWPNVAKTSPASVLSLCQLRHVKLTALETISSTVAINPSGVYCWFLFPAGTDVRRNPTVTAASPSNDWLTTTRIQFPAGTTRWYALASWEDRAAGFPNEHRAALCFRSNLDLVPVPPVGTALIQPIAVTCGTHTMLSRRYAVTIAGVGGICNQPGGECADLNGTTVIEHVGGLGCQWNGVSAGGCGGPMLITLSFSGGQWLLDINISQANYNCTAANFQPFGVSTFNKIGSVGPCTYPATISVQPSA